MATFKMATVLRGKKQKNRNYSNTVLQSNLSCRDCIVLKTGTVILCAGNGGVRIGDARNASSTCCIMPSGKANQNGRRFGRNTLNSRQLLHQQTKFTSMSMSGRSCPDVKRYFFQTRKMNLAGNCKYIAENYLINRLQISIITALSCSHDICVFAKAFNMAAVPVETREFANNRSILKK